ALDGPRAVDPDPIEPAAEPPAVGLTARRVGADHFAAAALFNDDAVQLHAAVQQPNLVAAPTDTTVRNLVAHRFSSSRSIERDGARIEQAPVKTVTTATTTTSELHVHFEHCLITLTRRLAGRPWWHPELIADLGWYLPGMKRGQLIPES